MSAPQFPSDHGFPEQSQATTALVLGILGLMMQILAPLAWVTANREIEAIHAGRRSPEGLQLASTARTLGIIGTVILGVGLLILVFVIAVLGARFMF